MSNNLSSHWFAIIGASGVILSAVYLLMLYQRIFFGPLNKAENAKLKDLTPMEIGLVVPMVIMFVWIGVQPNTFLGISESSARAVVGVVEGLKGENRYAAEANTRLHDSTVIIPARMSTGSQLDTVNAPTTPAMPMPAPSMVAPPMGAPPGASPTSPAPAPQGK